MWRVIPTVGCKLGEVGEALGCVEGIDDRGPELGDGALLEGEIPYVGTMLKVGRFDGATEEDSSLGCEELARIKILVEGEEDGKVEMLSSKSVFTEGESGEDPVKVLGAELGVDDMVRSAFVPPMEAELGELVISSTKGDSSWSSSAGTKLGKGKRVGKTDFVGTLVDKLGSVDPEGWRLGSRVGSIE